MKKEKKTAQLIIKAAAYFQIHENEGEFANRKTNIAFFENHASKTI